MEASNISQGDIVVEIGPGKGVLTAELLKRGAHVKAYELDQRMIEYLNEKFSSYVDQGQLVLIHVDVLDRWACVIGVLLIH